MTNFNVKRSGRVGISFQGRLYSASWIAEGASLTVTWHDFKQVASLKGYEEDPPKLAKKILNEIIQGFVPPPPKPK
jgi:hypothetical protein